jgi:CBS domain-containing protein
VRRGHLAFAVSTAFKGKFQMATVSQILQSKPDQVVHSVSPETSVFDAITLMADRNIGALLVTQDAKVVGICTERDYARKIALEGLSSRETPVGDIMTNRVMYVRPNQSVEECMALMTDNRLRHLPVMENGNVVGLISIGDLVNAVVTEQKFTINQLVHYISGDMG